MNPFWRSDNGETTLMLYQGHVLEMLRQMPAESVHCVVTSPPYWGLRDYKLEPQVWGGDPECEHEWNERRWYTEHSAAGASSEAFSEAGDENAERLKQARWRSDATCTKCAAWRGSLGLEPTPELYVQHLVEIFRELRRVLRRDGTLWLNMGDLYASQGGPIKEGGGINDILGGKRETQDYRESRSVSRLTPPDASIGSEGSQWAPIRLKPKDLLGMPWRVAFALQADGWWLRSDIIWAKPNPMPESVTDRPTKAHEFVFLLAKSERYYYDASAIREESISQDPRRPYGSNGAWEIDGRPDSQRHGGDWRKQDALGKATYTGFNERYRENPVLGRNKRTVWEIPTEPYPEAHFSTYPQKLVEPCILAGTSEKGVCPECGAAWERVTEQPAIPDEAYLPRPKPQPGNDSRTSALQIPGARRWMIPPREEIGWRPTCAHDKEPVPATCLDPFAGSGTTLLVAQRLGRNGVGVDLSEEYCRLAVKRLEAEHAQMRLML